MTFLTFSPKEKKESPSQTPSLERTEDSFLYQSLRSVAPPPQAQGSIQSLQRATAEASVLPPSLPSSELPSSQKGGLWKTSFLRLRAYFQVLGSSSQKSSQENDLEWLFSTPALFLYLLFALSYLLSFYSKPLWKGIHVLPELCWYLEAPQTLFAGQWIQPHHFKVPVRSLKETARSAVYFFSDPALEKDLEERFLNNSWVKEVHVSRDSYFASHIKVLVHLRKPCVGVEWENQLYLVDKEGVRVPEEIHPPSEPFLRVRGVRQKPPDLGEIWDDPVILPACKLARFLKKQKVHSWLDLQSIDMGNFEGKESPKEPEISLYTSQGTRICWGRPLESTRIEGDPHIKLKILKQFCERYPALKEIALVDIRFEEESFVLIQQAH